MKVKKTRRDQRGCTTRLIVGKKEKVGRNFSRENSHGKKTIGKKTIGKKTIGKKTRSGKTRSGRKIRGGAFLIDSLVTQGKVSSTYETDIEMNGNNFKLFYTVPRAFIFRKPQPVRVPTFEKKGGKLVNIKIGNRYIQFFVHITDVMGKYNGLYALMRLPIYGLNKGVFASFTNTRMFYKLNSSITIDPNSIEVVFDATNCFTEEDIRRKSWGIFVDRDVESVIHLNPEFYREVDGTNATDKEIFDVLNQFRREQYAKEAGKEFAVRTSAKFAGDMVLQNL